MCLLRHTPLSAAFCDFFVSISLIDLYVSVHALRHWVILCFVCVCMCGLLGSKNTSWLLYIGGSVERHCG